MTACALTVVPGVAGSVALVDGDRWLDSATAGAAGAVGGGDGLLVVDTWMVGVCGTDVEIVSGDYGTAPGADRSARLVIGHEAVGRVRVAPSGTGFAIGDLVVPIVRRPDPVPCPSCAVGEWDMCSNGRYTEHGIEGAHGFARTSFDLDPAFAVAAPAALAGRAVLVEPASVVAKAWEQVERIATRAHPRPRTALVTGAGPVGLLAALLAVQRGLDTHVLDLVTDGPKPALVADLGATYHCSGIDAVEPRPDVIVECTGVGSVVLDAVAGTAPNGIVCLAGLSTGARTIELDAAAWNRQLVLENDVVFGTVNANRRHYLAAVDALSSADPAWLDRLMSRRVPVADWPEALERREDDVKVVLEIG